MAITASRDEAFGFDTKRKLPRETYQLNVALDRRLMKPLKIAHLDQDRPLCLIVEGLVADFLAEGGYIDKELAQDISERR